MSVVAPLRTERRDPGGARVMPRDLVLLGFLADAGHASTSALGRLAGMSPDMARRRARALRDLGLVMKTVLAVNAPDRLTLTAAGRRMVAEKLGRDPASVSAVTLGAGPFRHHDMNVDLAVTLRIAGARSHAWTLVRHRFERQVRADLKAPGGALVPDGVAVLTSRGGGEVALALECDAGTCDPKWVATHKLAVYGAHFSAGAPLFGCARWAVCLVAPTLRRVHQLTTALWREGVPEGLVYLLPEASLTSETILLPTWLTPRAVPGTEDVVLAMESPLPPVTTDRHDGNDRHVEPEVAAGADFPHTPTGRSSARSAP